LKYKFDDNKANIFSVIIAVVTIWLIIVSYVVYYFKDDFAQVFCNKNKKPTIVKQKEG
jgi:regulatory protein YycH of two-component signal transduction system YycFG